MDLDTCRWARVRADHPNPLLANTLVRVLGRTRGGRYIVRRWADPDYVSTTCAPEELTPEAAPADGEDGR